MLGELDDKQIERVLQIERMGRIGCLVNGRVYVVPITYVYDDNCVYGHSAEGQKVAGMRTHPEVCFEVDQVDNLAHWRSVIAWGTYEELHGEEAQRGLRLMVERLSPRQVSETALLPPDRVPPPRQPTASEASRSAVAFRIKLTEKTGRFERTDG